MSFRSVARRMRHLAAGLVLGESPDAFLRSYSQQGEDLVLTCLFQNQRNGFYVDVGAHHPTRYSNTRFFYLRGWRGINIDPRPGIMAEFARLRPDDTNLEIGISLQPGHLTYHLFSDPAVNTFDAELARRHQVEEQFQLIEKRPIATRRLDQVLNEHLPPNQSIDFLSVDVEGFDEQVLMSNDWKLFRPRVVVAEDLSAFTFAQVLNSRLTRFMSDVGYVPISKMVHSICYCEASRARGTHDVLIA